MAVDLARHVLFSIPELILEGEPDGLVWFAYRASAAWIYAADSKCTSPSDGVVNVFRCVTDILDALDSTAAGDGTLVDGVMTRMDDEESLALLIPQVKDAVSQLVIDGI